MPDPDKIEAAVVKLCIAGSVSAAIWCVFFVVLDDAVDAEVDASEAPSELEEPEEAEELEEPDELGAVGVKVLFVTPKPMALASVPLPLIVIVSVSFLLVITSWPVLLIVAVTCALVGRSTLRVLIRSATVSFPVDVYVVELSPALTVIVPPGRMPRLDSEVLAVSGAVPVPVAGAPVVEELDEELEDDPVELVGDDDEPLSISCIAATSCELTRLSASPLAMLALPLDSVVIASPMALISDVLALAAELCDCDCCQ
jgi:hypothetical protein